MKYYEEPIFAIKDFRQDVIVMSGNGDLGFITDVFEEETK